MGCGNSKEAVATENTITLKKLNAEAVSGMNKDEEIKENNNNEEYFSPRKDDDHEFETRSEFSEYFSPHIGSGKQVSFFTSSVKFLGDDHSQDVFTDTEKEIGEVKQFEHLKDM
ncbi:uncharacterized protein [Euphorbia lathyris]|uniref:uncharacterized protein n=1 Tax=Euphorbia lathyris TaxID=212925 RepID=UPI0033131F4B